MGILPRGLFFRGAYRTGVIRRTTIIAISLHHLKLFPVKEEMRPNKYTLGYEHTIYTSTIKKKNGDSLITLFFSFLYRYIPLQKYTVPKDEKLRYRPGPTETPMPSGTQRSEVR